MKKKLSKLLSLALALSMALSLTACGGDKSAETPGSTDSSTVVSAPVDDPAAQGVTMSGYLSSGETIWYRVNGMGAGKDNVVGEILVFEADGTMYYAEGLELTLGELTKMEDADIVATVKEAHSLNALGNLATFPTSNVQRQKESLFHYPLIGIEEFAMSFPDGMPDDFLTGYMGSVEAQMVKPFLNELYAVYFELEMTGESYGNAAVGHLLEEYFVGASKEDAEEILSECFGPVGIEKMKALYDQCTAAAQAVCDYVENYEAEPGQYKFSLNTDQTGNVVESLTLAYRIPAGDGKYEIDSFTLKGASGEGDVVYDATYGGYVLFRGSSLLTRVDGSYNFVLEQIGENDLPVDVKPEELFQ